MYFSTSFFSVILRGCGVKKEDASVERWTRSLRQEVLPELPQATDSPRATHSPERKTQVGHKTRAELLSTMLHQRCCTSGVMHICSDGNILQSIQPTNQNETIVRIIWCIYCAVQTMEEEEDVLPAVDVKEEEMNNPSCSSVHLGGWSGTLDGEYCVAQVHCFLGIWSMDIYLCIVKKYETWIQKIWFPSLSIFLIQWRTTVPHTYRNIFAV